MLFRSHKWRHFSISFVIKMWNVYFPFVKSQRRSSPGQVSSTQGIVCDHPFEWKTCPIFHTFHRVFNTPAGIFPHCQGENNGLSTFSTGLSTINTPLLRVVPPCAESPFCPFPEEIRPADTNTPLSTVPFGSVLGGGPSQRASAPAGALAFSMRRNYNQGSTASGQQV